MDGQKNSGEIIISSSNRSSILVNNSWLLSETLKLTKTGFLHLLDRRLASVEDVRDDASPKILTVVGDFSYDVLIAKAKSLKAGSLSIPIQSTS